MAHSPDAVLKDLKAKKFAPIYFLEGDEPYFIDLITDYIEKHAIAEHEKGFNQLVMYGKDSQVNVILSNARKFPMMADRQVVIVKEAQSIPDLGKEDAQKLLLSYINNPLPSTILVFAHKHKKLDGRGSLKKELDKKTVFVNSEKVKDWKLTEWVENYIKELGHQIDIKAAQLLADSIGNNLEVISNEVGKMLINFSEPTKLTTEHISKYIGINKDYNNFELSKAIGYRDVIKANQIIHYFIQNPKAHPVIPIFSLLYNYFSKIALVHRAGPMPENQLAGVIGVHPYGVKEYLAVSRNYKLGKVIEVFGFIKEADLRFKGVDSGSMDEGEILRELVYKILH
ncbi:MAG: DNA polymerase III subunit delta [Algoriphagus sp.]|jgi:DNA polymerase-3 subunit delta|uniref:DNA polymerase III subunit delta n=1 Tax=Algoriphagus sp. TaxID=1872435 RepID=UPI0027201880|nr:DNA polymerase III subunit delta [Algoriphagus sp.]MDO8968140.1 DNA polymerase III subunit delta [Algoriphagus sp.]MDP2040765.1 DNA polymerase III subunit delta [Algoriphagus sp.]MDP3202241.1 DNA polymerase III subunit delta [Algoriphagus sp.]MDP3471292.1 DNA polymerase III subunit delta [Algoriphagus sp.]